MCLKGWLGLYNVFILNKTCYIVYETCSTWLITFTVCHTLLEVYGSPTDSKSTNHKDVSILVSSIELNIWEREALRRLRMRRLPVILKLVLITGDKALANAPRNGGSV